MASKGLLPTQAGDEFWKNLNDSILSGSSQPSSNTETTESSNPSFWDKFNSQYSGGYYEAPPKPPRTEPFITGAPASPFSAPMPQPERRGFTVIQNPNDIEIAQQPPQEKKLRRMSIGDLLDTGGEIFDRITRVGIGTLETASRVPSAFIGTQIGNLTGNAPSLQQNVGFISEPLKYAITGEGGQSTVTQQYAPKITGLTQALSFDKYKPDLSQYENVWGADASLAVGQIAGTIIQFNNLSSAIGKITSSIPTMVRFASNFPKVNRVLSQGLVWATQGQLSEKENTKILDRAKNFVTDFSTGGLTGALAEITAPIKGVKGASAAIAGSFATGFGLSKLDGASDKDAIVNGAIFASMTAAGRGLNKYATPQSQRNAAVDTFNNLGEPFGISIQPGSSADDISAAYKKLAKIYHPDVLGADNAIQVSTLNAARDMLITKTGALVNPQEETFIQEVRRLASTIKNRNAEARPGIPQLTGAVDLQKVNEGLQNTVQASTKNEVLEKALTYSEKDKVLSPAFLKSSIKDMQQNSGAYTNDPAMAKAISQSLEPLVKGQYSTAEQFYKAVNDALPANTPVEARKLILGQTFIKLGDLASTNPSDVQDAAALIFAPKNAAIEIGAPKPAVAAQGVKVPSLPIKAPQVKIEGKTGVSDSAVAAPEVKAELPVKKDEASFGEFDSLAKRAKILDFPDAMPKKTNILNTQKISIPQGHQIAWAKDRGIQTTTGGYLYKLKNGNEVYLQTVMEDPRLVSPVTSIRNFAVKDAKKGDGTKFIRAYLEDFFEHNANAKVSVSKSTANGFWEKFGFRFDNLGESQAIDKKSFRSSNVPQRTTETTTPQKTMTVYRGGEKIDNSKITNSGISVSTHRNIAEDFVKNKGGNIEEFELSPQAKIVKYEDVPNVKFKNLNDYSPELDNGDRKIWQDLEIEYQKALSWAKNNGYDAVKLPLEGEIRVANNNILVPKVKAPEVAPASKADVQALEKKVSKVAASVNAKAIEKKLTEGLADVAEYTPITIKDQAERIAKVMSTDIEQAKRIVRGEEKLPEGLRAGTVIKAMEDYAQENGDIQLIKDIASSPLTAETSVHAQEMRTLAERNPNSAVSIVQEVQKTRKKAYEKRTGSTTTKEKAKIVKEIKAKKPKVKREDWDSFISALEC